MTKQKSLFTIYEGDKKVPDKVMQQLLVSLISTNGFTIGI